MEINKIDKIFDTLSREDFKDPDSGLLFFPVYIYTYNPEDEYTVRKYIDNLNEKLKRPSNSLNCLILNVYHEFIIYLKSKTFAGQSLFDAIEELEKDDYADAFDYIVGQAESDEFISYLGEKYLKYFASNEEGKVYLLLHGFGSIFPYLRFSTLLNKTEQYTKKLKVIAFYPGDFKNSNYSLFGFFNDDNVYRANHLNQFL